MTIIFLLRMGASVTLVTMDMTLDPSDSRYVIRAYEAGHILINEKSYSQSVIITPQTLISPWQPQHFDQLTPDFLLACLSFSPQVVLLGTGVRRHHLSPDWLVPFYQQRIGVEVMDTSAACRTFNLLAGEGRKVVAGLLIA